MSEKSDQLSEGRGMTRKKWLKNNNFVISNSLVLAICMVHNQKYMF